MFKNISIVTPVLVRFVIILAFINAKNFLSLMHYIALPQKHYPSHFATSIAAFYCTLTTASAKKIRRVLKRNSKTRKEYSFLLPPNRN